MKRHRSFFRNQTLHSLMIKMPITTPFMLLSNPSFNFGHLFAVQFKVTMRISKLWKQGVIGISVEFSYLMEEPRRTVLTTKSSKRNFTTLHQRTSFRILAYPTHFELPIWTNSRRVTGSTWFYVSYASKVMETLFKHVIYKNRTAENEFNDLGIFWEKRKKDLRLNILHSKC